MKQSGLPILRDKFEHSHSDLAVDNNNKEELNLTGEFEAESKVCAITLSTEQRPQCWSQKGSEYLNIFDEMDNSPWRPGASAHVDNKIDHYLKDCRKTPDNVLQWWVEHQQVYP